MEKWERPSDYRARVAGAELDGAPRRGIAA
jgi:hypothetical protein